MKRKPLQSAAPLPIANDKPLIDRVEMQRAEASLTTRTMTPEERERYGQAVPRGNKPFIIPKRGESA